MNYRYLGAILVFLACGGFGFSVAASCRRETRMLHQIIRMTELMEQELNFRLTPLPELCRRTGKRIGGVFRSLLYDLAEELDNQILPDVSSCMRCVLTREDHLPRSVRRILAELGSTLGQFDLPGQLQGLQEVKARCSWYLQRLEQNQQSRMRSYQTLGLCAGAALAILFI